MSKSIKKSIKKYLTTGKRMISLDTSTEAIQECSPSHLPCIRHGTPIEHFSAGNGKIIGVGSIDGVVNYCLWYAFNCDNGKVSYSSNPLEITLLI